MSVLQQQDTNHLSASVTTCVKSAFCTERQTRKVLCTIP
ncbi:unnamed protein product [Oikopleura dioica]|uniref:Uncharacterized protein n=1 Tax=Oikopleura dioica TaxID=34765 RepID=E4Y3H9_OIKDI|nr:unnamed protein product [Oikopleura dioica]